MSADKSTSTVAFNIIDLLDKYGMENMEVIMSEIIVKRRWLKVARRCLGDLFIEKNI